MLPGSTLLLAVCVQSDFWPGGAWPLVDSATADTIAELCALGTTLSARQGGVCCRHHTGAAADPGAGPPHCRAGTAGERCAPGCLPAAPVLLVDPDATSTWTRDRSHALYVASGCVADVDATPNGRAAFDHLTAGIRDAVVFGAGVEYGIARAVDALLRRRVRTHLVLDAAAVADPAKAQRVVALWKRRAVDALTMATTARLLGRGAQP